MKLILNVWDALCSTSEFKVNGIEADSSDFGDKYDRDSEHAEEYCCADMHFTPKPATQEILKKYHISTDEYNTIAKELEDKLSFGSCGWCS